MLLVAQSLSFESESLGLAQWHTTQVAAASESVSEAARLQARARATAAEPPGQGPVAAAAGIRDSLAGLAAPAASLSHGSGIGQLGTLAPSRSAPVCVGPGLLRLPVG